MSMDCHIYYCFSLVPTSLNCMLCLKSFILNDDDNEKLLKILVHILLLLLLLLLIAFAVVAGLTYSATCCLMYGLFACKLHI